MDYTKHPVGLRIRKILSYAKFYRPSRTLIKIKGQYHTRRCYEVLPVIKDSERHQGHVGLIGCGNFAFSTGRHPIRITPTRASTPDCDVVVTFVLPDESIGSITFYARGYTFEGIRERFSAQRGAALIAMDDFKDLRIDVAERRIRPFPLFHDHGHEACVNRSYQMARPTSRNQQQGQSVEDIWATGELFLKTRCTGVWFFSRSPRLQSEVLCVL